MIQIRRAAERGAASHGWLQSFHPFSFADYYDPQFMGFSNLRVINDDRVAPGAGFATHGHRDMEIISLVLEGAIEHRDSLGHRSLLPAGELQVMSAGTGIRHSEYNASDREALRFLQIWILPDRSGHAPRYQQQPLPLAARRGRLQLVVSPDGVEGSMHIHQDLRLYAGHFDSGEQARHVLAPERAAWVQVARGSLSVNGQQLEEGDGIALVDEQEVVFSAGEGAEILLFDLRAPHA